MSGLSAAIGYLLGTLAGYGVAALLGRLGRTPAPAVRRYGWLALGVAVVVVVVAGLALWPGWQNQQRDLVGIEQLAPVALAPMVAATLVVFGLLLLARPRGRPRDRAWSTGCWPAGSPAWWPTPSPRPCSWSRPCS